MESDKPDLDEAIRRMAAEDRKTAGDHPDPEELLAYHERRLPEAEADRLQEHLVRCPECAAAVLDFAAFPDLEPPGEEHRLAPAEVGRRWRELEARLGERRRRPLWQRHELLLPLAAGLLLAAVGLGAWGLGLQREVERLEGPRGDVYVVAGLRPVEQGLRADPEARQVPDWAERAVVFLSLPSLDREVAAFEVDMTTEGVGRVLSGLEVRRDPDGFFVLEIPRHLLTPGRHTFELHGLEDGVRVRVARYALSIAER